MCSLIEFFREYPTEEVTVKWFEKQRWSNGVHCPYCDSKNISNCKSPMPYRCRGCRKHFSVRVRSILSESKLPLQTWALAIYILSNSKKGISSIQFAEMLGVTQKTAWFLAHRIREILPVSQKHKLSGTVEVDETYVGGLEKNKHGNKKLRSGRGGVGKIPVVGAKSRSGEVRAFVVPETGAETLTGIIRKNVEDGSNVYTDEWKSYTDLDEFNHNIVQHGTKEYVRGDIHTNGIESFWAIIKRGYKGIYHKWNVKHMQRYINEYCSRFNLRKLSPTARNLLIVQNGFDKQLSYKELIK